MPSFRGGEEYDILIKKICGTKILFKNLASRIKNPYSSITTLFLFHASNTIRKKASKTAKSENRKESPL
jgi:hypothetical protein